jgi:hypothetical protein
VVTSTGILRGVNGGGLEIKGIKKRYGDLEAVRDLSFESSSPKRSGE